MKNILPLPFIILVILALQITIAGIAQAEPRYIDDTLYAPLRSGEGLGFRIVHKGIKSGTRVELLSSSSESGYSKVRTPEGIEGWLPSRFLVRNPIAKDKLEALTKKYDTLKEQFDKLTKERTEIETSSDSISKNNRLLTESNNKLQEELTSIKHISANAINLDSRNRELRQLNEQLKNELEIMTAENIRLNENNERDKMLLGGGLVFLGVLIAIIIPMFKRDKRDSW